MVDQTFTVNIKASCQHVWEKMLTNPTYGQWTSAFQEGSFFEGSWERGSDIRFLALVDGKLSGLAGRIIENVPYERVTVEYLGEVQDGILDEMSEEARQWIGTHESYQFVDNDGMTNLTVQLKGPNVSDEMAEMIGTMWPPALFLLKQIIER